MDAEQNVITHAPLTKEAVLAACALSFQQFLAESHLTPEHISESDRGIFKAGYIMGCDYAMRHAIQAVTEVMYGC